jgi:hypothetical protein
MYDGELHGEPATPILEARAGDPLRINVLAPVSEQAQGFALEGHRWPVEPGMAGSNIVGSAQIAGLASLVIYPVGGAGGPRAQPGDFVYGSTREAYRESGMWGVLRVHPPEAAGAPLALAVQCETAGVRCDRGRADGILSWLGVAAFALAGVGVGIFRFRRRRRSDDD